MFFPEFVKPAGRDVERIVPDEGWEWA